MFEYYDTIKNTSMGISSFMSISRGGLYIEEKSVNWYNHWIDFDISYIKKYI